MRAALLLGFLLWQTGAANETPVARPEHMRYERTISLAAGAGQACAALDAAVFPHAAPALTDVRIFPVGAGGVAASGAREVPYAVTMSEGMTEETEAAKILNLGEGAGGTIVFDLEMPQRPYTDVTIDVDPAVQDFIATATVSGMDTLGRAAGATRLGEFTLFDLTAQHLSRDTTLPLEESNYRYLHVELKFSAAGRASGARFAPSMVEGAEVPPSREAQTIYTSVEETSAIATVGRESKASFVVPARVPVERVSFVLAPGFGGNFSRDVKVSATAEAPAKGSDDDAAGDGRAAEPEAVMGEILRVYADEAGQEIRTERLGVPAILGANLQRAAKVEVAVENGDDQPLPITAVRLEMRQRRVCFDDSAAAGAGLALYYGDAELVAPVYDYERLFLAARKPVTAELGAERQNPEYQARAAAALPFTERHPEVLWIVLICVVSALGVVALKSARNVGQ
jgi:uncharacterized protein DUF3999